MDEREVPVLIVGGSLVGLTTSLLLAARGVPHLVAERHRGTAIHPRAASFHQRTMEIFRGVGLQQEVESVAEREFVQHGAIVSVESLCGKELKYFYKSYSEGVEGLSATSRLFITQVGLEPLIRDKAAALGAEHRYGTELVSFEQDADEVRAVLRSRDGGAEQLVRAQYLVAADGAHSAIREQLGIPMQGRGTFANCITIYFRADVKPMLGDRNLSVVYVNHPTLLGFFRFSITADSGFLAVFVTSDADGGNRSTDIAADMSDERCVEYVRTALGCGPDVAIEIDSVQPWNASAGWAQTFSKGRVLLAGDAAHVVPPTGGFGGNTGIADAHNLAWKLAMVLDGTAAPELLETYDAERRPAGALISEQGYTRYVLRVDPTLPQDDLAPPLDDAGIELGIVYRSAAVVSPDRWDHADHSGDAASDAPPLDDPRAPSGRLGSRLPHIEVGLGGQRLSLHDVVGRGFVLLTGPGGSTWCAAAREAAARCGVRLDAYQIGPSGDLVAAADAFERGFALPAGGAVIVRPDGHLAWSAAGVVDGAPDVIEDVLARVLCRKGAALPA
jgi:2-polyprenyl-6-methoxyphenol hydroxylase-like FAD-dependent oxidoreductase